MKKYIRTLTVFLLILPFCLAAQKQTKNAPSPKEIEAIKSVIERETKAFFEIDYDTWKNHWVHAPYAFWSFADTTDVNSFTGWDQIHAGFAEYFKTAKPSTAKIDRNWLEFRIYGSGAYVRFTQLVKDDIRRPEQAEVRVLEKENGQWKIVCVSVIAMQKEKNIPQ
ncbi:MAG: nuclear transport factor 2 family protein [Bacteroidia bacterium]|nr:nuclear transport factor 2 family protein [Bacteroidia bacterium]